MAHDTRTRVRGAVFDAGRAAIHSVGLVSARSRPLPDFLIIGAKRGGTTSFYYDLLRHSRICPLFPRPDHLPKANPTKGIHYFDQNYWRGERWYRAHLPSARVRGRYAAGAPVVVGEASPYYLFHPGAAQRAAALVPHARIIVVLRDPVQRSYSHWKERRRNQLEDLDFAAALAAEDRRVGDVEDRLREDPRFTSYAHEQLSYARQSEYGPALRRWYDHYPAQRILALSSEDYYADADAVLATTQEFLGLPAERLASGTVRNAAAGSGLDAALAADLAARFAPSNAQVAELTGRTFAWTPPA